MEEDNLSRVASGKLSGSPGCICDRVYGLSMILNWDERKVLEKCKNGYDWIWGGWFCFSRIVWFLENKGAKLWFIMKLEFNHFKISVRVLKISFRSLHFLQYVLQTGLESRKEDTKFLPPGVWKDKLEVPSKLGCPSFPNILCSCLPLRHPLQHFQVLGQKRKAWRYFYRIQFSDQWNGFECICLLRRIFMRGK